MAAGVPVAVALIAGCSSGSSAASSSARSSAAASYGSLPSFLPSTTIQPDSVLTGTVAHPALTTEGDSVLVQLAGGHLLASIDGPVVPGEGLPYQAPATTCTWTVTLTQATGRIPVTVADFTTIDGQGAVYHPALVPGQPRPPAVVAPGRTVTFELRVVMRTGQGVMRWAPGGGPMVAEWDFVVEID